MNDFWINALANFGFPVVVALFLLLRGENTQQRLRDEIVSLKTEITTLSNTIRDLKSAVESRKR